jgi:hypothetical protein
VADHVRRHCRKAIQDAVTATASGSAKVGYMHLNGKRLGNLGVIEAIPNKAIKQFQHDQQQKLDKAAGEIVWAPGSRDGITGLVKKDCRKNDLSDCFIGRFGWLGDRGSLEDQVANAAYVEMNMTSTTSYEALYGTGKVAVPDPLQVSELRACQQDLHGVAGQFRPVRAGHRADGRLWPLAGQPTRSEVQVSQPEVIAGERIFKKLQCDTCHVIKRIDIDYEDTVLSKNFRDRLKAHVDDKLTPFLSYIGTDLLMHDMGYLSQVGDSRKSVPGRQRHRDAGVRGVRAEDPHAAAQGPALQQLRHRRAPQHEGQGQEACRPGLRLPVARRPRLHGDRGGIPARRPAIKQLQVIEELGKLSPHRTSCSCAHSCIRCRRNRVDQRSETPCGERH